MAKDKKKEGAGSKPEGKKKGNGMPPKEKKA